MASSREKAEAPSREPRYIVYVRLPFNRGDFVDPPPVDWNEAKSEDLWSIISGVAKTEINWDELAAGFGVTVEFLLQMASYLTERHTSQLRAQMRKATVINTAATRGSSAPSPVPWCESPVGHHPATTAAAAAAEAIMRTGSAAGVRAPSALSVRRDSPMPRNTSNNNAGGNNNNGNNNNSNNNNSGSGSGNYNNDDGGSAPGTPAKAAFPHRPPVSRNSSTNTAVMLLSSQNPTGTGKPAARLSGSQRRRLSSLPISTTAPVSQESGPSADAEAEAQAQADAADAEAEEEEESDPLSPGPAESSRSPSSASSSSSDSPIESRIIRRPPLFKTPGGGEGGGGGGGGGGVGGGPLFPRGDDDDDDDNDEAEPAFLPFRAQTVLGGGGAGPSSSRGGNPVGVGGGRAGAVSQGAMMTQDLGATLRGDPRDFGRRLLPSGRAQAQAQQDRDKDRDSERGDQSQQSQTSDSSTSSAAIVSKKALFGIDDAKRPGLLSPRRTAELVGRSSGITGGSGGGGSGGGGKGKGKLYSREGSDGTPSMGSSFSDLDDASVTQSALEEALASKMQGTTIGSRMSNLGEAIRSRYLPKSGRS